MGYMDAVVDCGRVGSAVRAGLRPDGAVGMEATMWLGATRLGLWWTGRRRVGATGTRRRMLGAVTAGLLLAAVAGCDVSRETNGLEEKPPAEVLQTAALALKTVGSVHVTGVKSTATPVRVDVRLQRGTRSGTVVMGQVPLEFMTISGDAYLKGDQAAWTAVQAPPPVAGFSGRWVRLPAEQVRIEPVTIDGLAALVADNAWLTDPKLTQEVVGGRKVVVLSRRDGSRLLIANTGRANVLRIEDKSSNGWQLDLTEHGVDFSLTPPGDALSNAMTAAELAWLEALRRLEKTMDQVFSRAPSHLTPSAMSSMSTKLAGCARELARMGSPGDRLKPAYELVKKACAEYGKGSQCFATAASIGIPFAGSAAARRLDEAIQCGFDSSAASMTLGDAVAEAEEIKAKGD